MADTCKRAHTLRTVHTYARSPRKGERATLLQENSFCEHSFWSRECTIPRTGLKSFSFKMYSSEKLGESVKWKKLERVTVCVLSSRMSCVAQRTVASISVKKRDKKRNSFISAFCFIKLIFQVDWMYTRFVVM